MPRNDLAGVLDAKSALDGRLEEVAELRSDRENSPEKQDGTGSSGTEGGKTGGDHKTRRKPADGAGPGLLWADLRPKFWTANDSPRKITASVGHPYDQQDKHQRGETISLIESHQNRCDLRTSGIGKPRRNPEAALLDKQQDDAAADEKKDERAIDPPRCKKKSCCCERCGAHRNRTRCKRAHDGEPFDIKADCRKGHQRDPKPSAGVSERYREWGQHHGCGRTHQQIARPLLGAGRCCLAFGHDPVFTAKPPNRRSRLAYSAIASSSAALSKSGQWVGTKTSSL